MIISSLLKILCFNLSEGITKIFILIKCDDYYCLISATALLYKVSVHPKYVALFSPAVVVMFVFVTAV